MKHSWTLETTKNNNKPGKVNLSIIIKFQNGNNDKKVDSQFSPGRTENGTPSVEDYKSQSSGNPVGYGMVKVHIGRADANTNVNYKITLTKTGNLPTVIGKSSNGSGNSNNNNNNDYNYSDLGSKTGNVIANTVGIYHSDKKACKNNATVRVTKTDGKARTTILNQFGINNKFIRVGLKIDQQPTNSNIT